MTTIQLTRARKAKRRRKCEAKDLQVLARRMGKGLVRRRLLRQADKWAKTAHQGEGPFQFERLLPLDRLIKSVLKLTGMYARGRRNFFDIQIVENRVEVARLPRALEGLRILQLSDLHLDLEPSLADIIVQKLDGLEYDIAVITGDYRNSCTEDYARSLDLTGRVVAALKGPRYGILGNHDFLEMAPELERLGLPMLLNESEVLTFRGQPIFIAGIDDPHFYETANFSSFEAWNWSHRLRILLAHSPGAYALAARYGFDFMMSGHTHGGQICLPGGIPIIRNGNCPPNMLAGPWVYAGLTGYTSRGTGSCGVAARFFCPPEITIHEFVCPAG